MKRCFLMIGILGVGLCGCTAWVGQYELGMRFDVDHSATPMTRPQLVQDESRVERLEALIERLIEIQKGP